jgi:hypothetical protein
MDDKPIDRDNRDRAAGGLGIVVVVVVVGWGSRRFRVEAKVGM